jgi:hypothetical protein
MRLLIRIIPVLITGIFLSFYLEISLLIVSSLLLCWLIYLLQKPPSLSEFRPNTKILFIGAIVATLGSKILFFLKDIYLNHDGLRASLNRPIILYKICSLSVSYQSFGFIKRGLIPTIVNIISPLYTIQIYAVQLIGFGIFIAGLLLINDRKDFRFAPKKIFIAILLLSPIGIYSYFNYNLGFYDMILIGLLLISISAGNRPTSVLADILGLLIHEAYIFLRLPFLIFDLISLILNKKPYAFILVRIFINLAVLLLIVKSPRPGLEELKANYFSHYPSLKSVTQPGDMEAFSPLCKEGTLASDLNEIQATYNGPRARSLYIPLIVSFCMITLFGSFTSTLSGRRRTLDVSASGIVFLTPLILCLVGGDFGRWLGFSWVCWAIYYLLFRPVLFSETEPSFKYLYGAMLTALLFSPFGINYNPLFFTWMGH